MRIYIFAPDGIYRFRDHLHSTDTIEFDSQFKFRFLLFRRKFSGTDPSSPRRCVSFLLRKIKKTVSERLNFAISNRMY